MAEKNFEKVFEKNKQPDQMPEVKIDKASDWPVADLLVEINLADSKSQARRLIEQGGVRIDGATIGDSQATITIKSGMVVNVGKTKYKKIVIK